MSAQEILDFYEEIWDVRTPSFDELTILFQEKGWRLARAQRGGRVLLYKPSGRRAFSEATERHNVWKLYLREFVPYRDVQRIVTDSNNWVPA